ncbi:MAG: ATP-grasp domain-containing protein [Rhodoferax sp.]|nr:ATP-grasp domain-containing protein [Rhodoferax sp.]
MIEKTNDHTVDQPRGLVLFNYDWDQWGFSRWSRQFSIDSVGFDLFNFPSNVRLMHFDLDTFVDRLAARSKRAQWQGVTSNHEQFGALAAALLAERMGWAGTPVTAVLACQHKWYARQVLEQVDPAANTPAQPMASRYGEPVPHDLHYPLFVKPVKAAFSVLAKEVHNREELAALTQFSWSELWVIRRLVEPFERVVRQRLPHAGSAHRMLLEQPVHALQYNLDGYVFGGEVRPLGVVESVMYPGTQAFMRFAYPCPLAAAGRARAVEVAQRFLQAVGFTHGLFNMEFVYDASTDRLTVIEFNPRMAAQFSDLYLRVDGVDLHRIGLELAFGRDPAALPRAQASAAIAASFVYRSFNPAERPTMPTPAQTAQLQHAFPDARLFSFPKNAGQIARDFKWLGSYRYGILHLEGRDAADLQARCTTASRLLGWPTPCALHPPRRAPAAVPTHPTLLVETYP